MDIILPAGGLETIFDALETFCRYVLKNRERQEKMEEEESPVMF